MPGFWERMDRNPLPKYRSKSCHKIDQIVQLSCFFMLRLWEIGGGGLQQKRASYLLPHLISISPSLSSSSRLFPAHSLSLVQSHSHHHLCTVGVFSFGSFIEFLKWVWNCGWPQYRDRDTAHLKAGGSVEIYVMPLLSIPLERWKHLRPQRLPEIAYLQKASKVGTWL